MRCATNVGFGLIEALIAVVLGAIVCLTAWAGLRSATQLTTTCERLATANRLMRAGMLAALDDLDTWRSFDVPALRQDGQPFAPLALERDEFDCDFDPSLPKTWYRGAGVVSNGLNAEANRDYGDYSLHARLGAIDMPGQSPGERRWYANHVSRLTDRLGYYGLIEYLPPNTLFSFFAEDGLVPAEFHVPSPYAQLRSLYLDMCWGRDHDQPRDRRVILGFGGPVVTTDPGYLADGSSRRIFTGYLDSGPYSLTGLLNACPRAPQVPLKPAHWPDLSVSVGRYAINGRFFALGDIVAVDPVTGERTSVTFTTHTTTLRGARRQRGLDRTPP